MNYHFLTPVWGPSYVKLFTEVSLRTQLSEGNLGAFVNEPGAIYEIMTRREDIPRIQASRAFSALARMIKTEFVPIDDYSMRNSSWKRDPTWLFLRSWTCMLRGHKRQRALCIRGRLGQS